MDAITAIRSRRSIRKYTAESVPDSAVQALLEAAMAAPSAGNQQPWQLLVIDEASVLDQIPSVHPHAEMVPQAELAILVCGDLSRERHKGFWVQDCAAATENLLLAATALGLGAVWLGVYPREDRVAGMRALLELPKHIVPLALVPIGLPGESKRPVNRFDPSRVHRNRWSG